MRPRLVIVLQLTTWRPHQIPKLSQVEAGLQATGVGNLPNGECHSSADVGHGVRRDGFVILPNLLDADTLDRLRQAMDRFLKDPFTPVVRFGALQPRGGHA